MITLQRAQELFDLMNSKSCDACNASCSDDPHCIPFKHARDGCYARAHEMCRLMMAEGEQPGKVWLYGYLHADTPNDHDKCGVDWSWHVAPTLMVTTPSGSLEKYVIDPSLCTGPVTVAAWMALQGVSSGEKYSPTWEPFWSNWYLYPESEWLDHGITDPDFSKTKYHLEQKCGYLQEDCAKYGPPPYACPIIKTCHFIVDRNTFSDAEIEAMIHISSPAIIEAAFYIVVDGFSPDELGFTSATMEKTPTLNISQNVSGMTIAADHLAFDFPTHLKRRQRLTWVYNIRFNDISGFTSEQKIVKLSALLSTVTSEGYIYLIKQPNPYEIDGQTTWLSTDLRVFSIKAGQPKFGATVAGNTPIDAINFIRQVITNLTPGGNSEGQTFENDLDPNATELALNQFDPNGTAIFNFAIAKVRYRAIAQDAQTVRVFFRLCPALTVSTDYDANDPTPTIAHKLGNVYRRYTDGVQYGQSIPLLGTQNNNILTIPCFATIRTSADMTTQQDIPNVQTIEHNTTGAEIHRYFGCWLDINQPGSTWYPLNPTNDGPFSGNLKSVLELLRNQHQCLLSEIVFDPDPISNGATPGTSDKLAQRNLSLIPSANPGDEASRRIPNTFELKPTQTKSLQEPDELMIDWGNTPTGSIARIFLPTVSVDDILELAARRYSAAKLTRVDEHTIELRSNQITYIPIPPGQTLNHTGLLTLDLPPGVQKGQMFHAVVRQVTNRGTQKVGGLVEGKTDEAKAKHFRIWKQVIGTFQISIPVKTKDVMLGPEENLFSIMQWILESIPPHNRWYPVFHRYVGEIGKRVKGLGGNPALIPPSPTGHWHRPRPHPDGEERIMFSGKVSGLIYDRFGDFEGFILDTEDGERKFFSREKKVEKLTERAWRERLRIIVWAECDKPYRPLTIIVREPPASFGAFKS